MLREYGKDSLVVLTCSCHVSHFSSKFVDFWMPFNAILAIHNSFLLLLRPADLAPKEEEHRSQPGSSKGASRRARKDPPLDTSPAPAPQSGKSPSPTHSPAGCQTQAMHTQSVPNQGVPPTAEMAESSPSIVQPPPRQTDGGGPSGAGRRRNKLPAMAPSAPSERLDVGRVEPGNAESNRLWDAPAPKREFPDVFPGPAVAPAAAGTAAIADRNAREALQHPRGAAVSLRVAESGPILERVPPEGAAGPLPRGRKPFPETVGAIPPAAELPRGAASPVAQPSVVGTSAAAVGKKSRAKKPGGGPSRAAPVGQAPAVAAATLAAAPASEGECVMCMDAGIETLLAPCGHQALCW